MAGVRHAYISSDGRSIPERLNVGGQVDFIAANSVGVDWRGRHDLIWIHAAARDGSGADLPGLLRRLAPVAPCVVLADLPDDRTALACFSAGARGYCNSHAQPRILKLVADVVLQGGLWIGESLMQRLVAGVGFAAQAKAPGDPAPRAGAGALLGQLTPREREVAEAIAAGASNKDVARLLAISERTVKAHASTIFDKLGVKDRLQLAVRIIGLRK